MADITFGTDNYHAIPEGTVYTAALTFSDPDDPGLESNYSAAVQVFSDEARTILHSDVTGTITDNSGGGFPSTDEPFILTITPDVEFSGDVYVSVSVTDESGNASTPGNFHLYVTPFDDTPFFTNLNDVTATQYTLNMDEGGIQTINIRVKDPDNDIVGLVGVPNADLQTIFGGASYQTNITMRDSAGNAINVDSVNFLNTTEITLSNSYSFGGYKDFTVTFNHNTTQSSIIDSGTLEILAYNNNNTGTGSGLFTIYVNVHNLFTALPMINYSVTPPYNENESTPTDIAAGGDGFINEFTYTFVNTEESDLGSSIYMKNVEMGSSVGNFEYSWYQVPEQDSLTIIYEFSPGESITTATIKLGKYGSDTYTHRYIDGALEQVNASPTLTFDYCAQASDVDGYLYPDAEACRTHTEYIQIIEHPDEIEFISLNDTIATYDDSAGTTLTAYEGGYPAYNWFNAANAATTTSAVEAESRDFTLTIHDSDDYVTFSADMCNNFNTPTNFPCIAYQFNGSFSTYFNAQTSLPTIVDNTQGGPDDIIFNFTIAGRTSDNNTTGDHSIDVKIFNSEEQSLTHKITIPYTHRDCAGVLNGDSPLGEAVIDLCGLCSCPGDYFSGGHSCGDYHNSTSTTSHQSLPYFFDGDNDGIPCDPNVSVVDGNANPVNYCFNQNLDVVGDGYIRPVTVDDEAACLGENNEFGDDGDGSRLFTLTTSPAGLCWETTEANCSCPAPSTGTLISDPDNVNYRFGLGADGNLNENGFDCSNDCNGSRKTFRHPDPTDNGVMCCLNTELDDCGHCPNYLDVSGIGIGSEVGNYDEHNNSGTYGHLKIDCNSECYGTAFINVCSHCVEGTTGIDNTNDLESGFIGFYGQDCAGMCTNSSGYIANYIDNNPDPASSARQCCEANQVVNATGRDFCGTCGGTATGDPSAPDCEINSDLANNGLNTTCNGGIIGSAAHVDCSGTCFGTAEIVYYGTCCDYQSGQAVDNCNICSSNPNSDLDIWYNATDSAAKDCNDACPSDANVGDSVNNYPGYLGPTPIQTSSGLVYTENPFDDSGQGYGMDNCGVCGGDNTIFADGTSCVGCINPHSGNYLAGDDVIECGINNQYAVIWNYFGINSENNPEIVLPCCDVVVGYDDEADTTLYADWDTWLYTDAILDGTFPAISYELNYDEYQNGFDILCHLLIDGFVANSYFTEQHYDQYNKVRVTQVTGAVNGYVTFDPAYDYENEPEISMEFPTSNTCFCSVESNANACTTTNNNCDFGYIPQCGGLQEEVSCGSGTFDCNGLDIGYWSDGDMVASGTYSAVNDEICLAYGCDYTSDKWCDALELECTTIAPGINCPSDCQEESVISCPTCTCVQDPSAIFGCTDSTATNYDETATHDDGSCENTCSSQLVYFTSGLVSNPTDILDVTIRNDIEGGDGNETIKVQLTTTGVGCRDESAMNYDVGVTNPCGVVSPGLCCQYETCTDPNADNYGEFFTLGSEIPYSGGIFQYILEKDEPEMMELVEDPNSGMLVDIGTCRYSGCTDPGAMNYLHGCFAHQPCADNQTSDCCTDDGSCVTELRRIELTPLVSFGVTIDTMNFKPVGEDNRTTIFTTNVDGTILYSGYMYGQIPDSTDVGSMICHEYAFEQYYLIDMVLDQLVLSEGEIALLDTPYKRFYEVLTNPNSTQSFQVQYATICTEEITTNCNTCLETPTTYTGLIPSGELENPNFGGWFPQNGEQVSNYYLSITKGNTLVHNITFDSFNEIKDFINQGYTYKFTSGGDYTITIRVADNTEISGISIPNIYSLEKQVTIERVVPIGQTISGSQDVFKAYNFFELDYTTISDKDDSTKNADGRKTLGIWYEPYNDNKLLWNQESGEALKSYEDEGDFNTDLSAAHWLNSKYLVTNTIAHWDFNDNNQNYFNDLNYITEARLRDKSGNMYHIDDPATSGFGIALQSFRGGSQRLPFDFDVQRNLNPGIVLDPEDYVDGPIGDGEYIVMSWWDAYIHIIALGDSDYMYQGNKTLANKPLFLGVPVIQGYGETDDENDVNFDAFNIYGWKEDFEMDINDHFEHYPDDLSEVTNLPGKYNGQSGLHIYCPDDEHPLFVGGDAGECINDDSTSDTQGAFCSNMPDPNSNLVTEGYDNHPEWCDSYDDANFTSSEQCCVCDGGTILDETYGEYKIHNINTIEFLINGTCNYYEFPLGDYPNLANRYQGMLAGVLAHQQGDDGLATSPTWEMILRPGDGTIKGGLARNFSPKYQLENYYDDKYYSTHIDNQVSSEELYGDEYNPEPPEYFSHSTYFYDNAMNMLSLDDNKHVPEPPNESYLMINTFKERDEGAMLKVSNIDIPEECIISATIKIRFYGQQGRVNIDETYGFRAYNMPNIHHGVGNDYHSTMNIPGAEAILSGGTIFSIEGDDNNIAFAYHYNPNLQPDGQADTDYLCRFSQIPEHCDDGFLNGFYLHNMSSVGEPWSAWPQPDEKFEYEKEYESPRNHIKKSEHLNHYYDSDEETLKQRTYREHIIGWDVDEQVWGKMYVVFSKQEDDVLLYVTRPGTTTLDLNMAPIARLGKWVSPKTTGGNFYIGGSSPKFEYNGVTQIYNLNGFIDEVKIEKITPAFTVDAEIRTIKSLRDEYANVNLYNYYDASLENYLHKYLTNTAPAQVLFYFYPREQYDENSVFLNIFEPREVLPIDETYYIALMNYGDEQTEFYDKPHQLSYSTTISHFYEEPGIYEGSGYLLKVIKDELGQSTGVQYYVKFTFVIKLNEDTSKDNFKYLGGDYKYYPYNYTSPIIGGISKESLYYKSLKRNLGFIGNDDEPTVDVNLNINDYLNMSDALATTNDYFDYPLAIPYETQYQLDYDSSKETVYTGIHRYENELGDHISNLDLGQIRYFKRPMQMWEMLGFECDDYLTSEEDANLLPYNMVYYNTGLEYTGNGYGFYEYITTWGHLGVPDEGFITFTGEFKVDTARANSYGCTNSLCDNEADCIGTGSGQCSEGDKNASWYRGQVRLFVFTRHNEDGWVRAQNTGTYNTDWIPFQITYQRNDTSDNPDGYSGYQIRFAAYHYPSGANAGTSYIKNLQINTSEGPQGTSNDAVPFHLPSAVLQVGECERADAGNPDAERYWNNIVEPDFDIYTDTFGDFYYPVLPVIDENDQFTDGIQGSKTPFGSPGRAWNEEDVNAYITNDVTDDDLLIDINYNEIDKNVFGDESGNQNLGFVIKDYKIDLTEDYKPEKEEKMKTFKPSKEDKAY